MLSPPLRSGFHAEQCNRCLGCCRIPIGAESSCDEVLVTVVYWVKVPDSRLNWVVKLRLNRSHRTWPAAHGSIKPSKTSRLI